MEARNPFDGVQNDSMANDVTEKNGVLSKEVLREIMEVHKEAGHRKGILKELRSSNITIPKQKLSKVLKLVKCVKGKMQNIIM